MVQFNDVEIENESSLLSNSQNVNCTKSISILIKNTLFQGLDDEDEEIRKKVFNFCNNEYSLNVYER